jgi:arginine/lysine/ornithine decarboxylase
MSLFATTSPSYLILASLDRANRILSDGFSKKLLECIARLDASKRKLSSHGWELSGDEPLKLTLMPKSFGYLGSELAAILEEGGVFCEFFDKDHLVAMLSPYNAPSDIDRFESILLSLERKAPIKEKAPPVLRAQRAMDVTCARLSPCEKTPVELSEGKILASACESCPPAIPIMLCGEVISKECIEAFKYYGTKDVLTVKSYER